jgi:transcription antitermination factor NusG
MMELGSTNNSISEGPWYAVQVKATHEKRVAAALDYFGFNCFLPLYESRRRWSDRVREVELPLFPGYLFTTFDPVGRVAVLKTPSVIRIVGIGYEPTPIDDREIAALRAVVSSGMKALPHPFLQVGKRVRIEGGALTGAEGIITNMRKPNQLILSVTLLQKSIVVEIDSAWVKPILQSSHSPRSERVTRISA